MKVDIDNRTCKFAVEAIKLVSLLPKSTAGLTIANQLIRSGTSNS